MNALILRTVTPLILPVALAFSLYLLWRGHNEPGGGFVGGLIAAVGFALVGLSRGREAMLSALKITPQAIAGIGLLFALSSTVPALFSGQAILTHHWFEAENGFAIGTTLLFDIGVYLAVLGGVLTLLSYYLED